MKWLVPFAFLISFALYAEKKIIFWHAFDGSLEQSLNNLVSDFNETLKKEKSAYIISTENHARYETLFGDLTKGKPHIAQIGEMATLSMKSLDLHIPISTLMPDLDETLFLDPLRAFYKAHENKLVSLPFNASTVVLYYNATQLEKYKLAPPKTWEEVERACELILTKRRQSCFATGWFVGHLIEQTGAIHNKQIATFGNGIDSPKSKILFDQPFFRFHLDKMRGWRDLGYLSFSTGPDSEADFGDEKVFFLSQGANRIKNIQSKVGADFQIGVTSFPYWKNQIKTPFNTMAGGASLWVLKGFSKEEYSVIKNFLTFMASKESQITWHQTTGYLPVIKSAFEYVMKNPSKNFSPLELKAFQIALTSYSPKPSNFSRGILLENYLDKRNIIQKEIEKAIKGEKRSEYAMNAIEAATLGTTPIIVEK